MKSIVLATRALPEPSLSTLEADFAASTAWEIPGARRDGVPHARLLESPVIWIE